MSNDFVFSDNELEKVKRSSNSRLQNFQQILDDTSNDIRKLEKWLQECGVCMFVSVPIQSESIHILWDKVKDSWRLLYMDSQGNEKPLLEASARIRLAAKPFLPRLVRQIEQYLPDPLEHDSQIDLEDLSF